MKKKTIFQFTFFNRKIASPLALFSYSIRVTKERDQCRGVVPGEREYYAEEKKQSVGI